MEYVKDKRLITCAIQAPTRGELVLSETYLNGHVIDIEYIEDSVGDMILFAATDEENGEVKTGLHPVCAGLRFK